MRFRDIAAFVLQGATFPHPTSSLRKIFPCSPGSRWSEGVGLIVRAVRLEDFQPVPPASQTDGWTDRRHAI